MKDSLCRKLARESVCHWVNRNIPPDDDYSPLIASDVAVIWSFRTGAPDPSCKMILTAPRPKGYIFEFLVGPSVPEGRLIVYRAFASESVFH